MSDPTRILILLLASSSLAAQGSVASPPGALSQEGEHASYTFGRYAEARFQFVEGDLRGTPRSFTGVSYRLDYRDHDSTTATGRQWSNVNLHVAETDYAKFSAFYNQNPLNTPTLVFSATVDWPTQAGRPLVKPDVWGGLTGKLQFSFTQPYAFTGSNDLLLDYDFSGGVLANSATWQFTEARFYYLDGETVTPGPRTGATASYPPSGTCADSSFPQTNGAASTIEALVYSDTETNPAWRGNLRLWHETSYTAPSAPIVQVISLSGLPAGAWAAAHCNLLYLDLSQPWLPIGGITDSSGYSGRALGAGEYIVPFVPAVFGGLRVWTQGAWTDTQSRNFALTRAASVVIPSTKPLGVVPRKKAAYHYVRNLMIGFGPTEGVEVNPFLLLDYK